MYYICVMHKCHIDNGLCKYLHKKIVKISMLQSNSMFNLFKNYITVVEGG